MYELGADDTAVRRVHLVVLTMPLLLVAALWAAAGATDLFRQIVFPGVVVVHGTLLAGLLGGRLTVRQTGPWVVLSPGVIITARLLTWAGAPASRPTTWAW